MPSLFEKYGTFGAIVAAAACPVCFPKLAILGVLIGFDMLAEYEPVFFVGTQVLIIVALVGHMISYRRQRNKAILILSLSSVLLFFASLYAIVSEALSYVAFAGLVVATVWIMVENRRCVRCEAKQNSMIS